MRLLWLAAVLRAEGLHVIELDGWRTRGADRINPQGLVWHHTATPPSVSDVAVRKLLRDGRSDLPGPLSQLGLERDGTFVVVAAGRCNHNGHGTWGNDSIGIEAYNDGRGEPWPQPLLDAYDRGSAAILRRMGWNISHIRGHKETDPARKIDPTFNMDDARARVFALLNPTPVPTPPEGDDMFSYEYDTTPNAAGGNVVAIVAGGKQVRVNGHDTLVALRGMPTHLGPINKAMFESLKKAYGAVIS